MNARERRQLKSIYKVRLKHLISAQHNFVLGKANNESVRLLFLLRDWTVQHCYLQHGHHGLLD